VVLIPILARRRENINSAISAPLRGMSYGDGTCRGWKKGSRESLPVSSVQACGLAVKRGGAMRRWGF